MRDGQQQLQVVIRCHLVITLSIQRFGQEIKIGMYMFISRRAICTHQIGDFYPFWWVIIQMYPNMKFHICWYHPLVWLMWMFIVRTPHSDCACEITLWDLFWYCLLPCAWFDCSGPLCWRTIAGFKATCRIQRFQPCCFHKCAKTPLVCVSIPGTNWLGKKISCTWAQHCSNAKQHSNRAEPTLQLNQTYRTYRIIVAYGSSMHMFTIDLSLQFQPLQKLLIIGNMGGYWNYQPFGQAGARFSLNNKASNPYMIMRRFTEKRMHSLLCRKGPQRNQPESWVSMTGTWKWHSCYISICVCHPCYE